MFLEQSDYDWKNDTEVLDKVEAEKIKRYHELYKQGGTLGFIEMIRKDKNKQLAIAD